jgi:hypothetical protein
MMAYPDHRPVLAIKPKDEITPISPVAPMERRGER